MKVMISQPMNGKTEEQIRKERKDLVMDLESLGYEVVDTIFTDEPKKAEEAPLFYLARSIEAMNKVDAVVFMSGWENARGCIVEHEVARMYGKFIKEF